MKYRDIEKLLIAPSFDLLRQQGSHRLFQGIIEDRRRIVTLAYHSRNADVLPKTLGSIIRQTGLPKRLFK